ncbi:DUF4260 family protein [Candidimonas sp. SYP-B2681]|uniref:DUF4260 domain-containing protein n=1 Tax=Candidimonas sp. SYP-B2681 TaxID=2497686 RepID=UPI000F88F5F0|nr:DUF4260 domain-containing protein [Candidimonas sp. SYP-B2681]RTZ45670.1 DUF4260 family protein [Candidimonas sp. SYP-B2681]
MPGDVTGGVRLILRLEGLVVLAAASLAYSEFADHGWTIFAICFLLPDISFSGYLLGPKAGAAAYNFAHSYIGAVVCLIVGLLSAIPLLLTIGLIWCAHIGFDRMLGYGLKYQAGFSFTHFGRIGKQA